MNHFSRVIDRSEPAKKTPSRRRTADCSSGFLFLLLCSSINQPSSWHSRKASLYPPPPPPTPLTPDTLSHFPPCGPSHCRIITHELLTAPPLTRCPLFPPPSRLPHRQPPSPTPPSPRVPRGADKAADYLCDAASVFCSD